MALVSKAPVEAVMRGLSLAIDGMELPAIEKISEDQAEDPFQVLIATLLSALNFGGNGAVSGESEMAAQRVNPEVAHVGHGVFFHDLIAGKSHRFLSAFFNLVL